MALSILLRNSACTSSMLGQHILRLVTQHALPHRALVTAAALPNRTPVLKKADKMSTLISTRAFSTSPARLSGEKPHDHARLWVIEKATSALLVGLIPLGLLMPNKIVDSALAILICAHSFWGLEAIAVDYVRASIFGPVIPKIAIALVYLVTIATLGGLFYMISHDVGLCQVIRQFWAVRSHQKA